MRYITYGSTLKVENEEAKRTVQLKAKTGNQGLSGLTRKHVA
jgi:hypothetical protein